MLCDDSASVIESVICEIFAQILQTGSFHPNHDFLALGGGGISAMRVTSLARRQGIESSVANLMSLKLACSTATSTTIGTSAKTSHVGDVPLSPIQRWFFGRPTVR